MSTIGIILVAVSAAMHASWNLLSKKARGTGAFFLIAMAFGTLILAPLGIFGAVTIGMPANVWSACAISGFALAVYFASLGWSYEHGDMSVVYPLVRALPVAAVALIKGVGSEAILPPAVLGVVLVTGGCLWLGLEQSGGHHSAEHVRTHHGLAYLFVALTAGATVVFSLVDKYAMSHLDREVGGLEGAAPAYLYAYWEFTFTAAFLTPLLLVKVERVNMKDMNRTSWLIAAAVSVLNLATYGLVVWAMQSSKVSYVVAFRQLSIVFGVLMAGLLLRERRFGRRLTAAVVVFAGVALVGLSDIIWPLIIG